MESVKIRPRREHGAVNRELAYQYDAAPTNTDEPPTNFPSTASPCEFSKRFSKKTKLTENLCKSQFSSERMSSSYSRYILIPFGTLWGLFSGGKDRGRMDRWRMSINWEFCFMLHFHGVIIPPVLLCVMATGRDACRNKLTNLRMCL